MSVLDSKYIQVYKKEMIENMKRMNPNWDEDNLAIVMKDVELPKQFSNKPLDEFGNWMGDIIPKYEKSKATEDNSEIYYINKLDDIRAMVRYASNNNKKVEIEGVDVTQIQAEAQQEYEGELQKQNRRGSRQNKREEGRARCGKGHRACI